ncbi:MAG: hypothetical protein ACT4P8_16705 [Betaproteobacteria bacterium]
MSTTAYDGVFLAPESIVIYPGLPHFDLNCSAPANRAGVRTERLTELAAHPGRSSSEQ